MAFCEKLCAALQTFKKWYEKKADAMREKERAAEEARRKRGAMTGREIFAEVRAEAELEHSGNSLLKFACAELAFQTGQFLKAG